MLEPPISVPSMRSLEGGVQGKHGLANTEISSGFLPDKHRPNVLLNVSMVQIICCGV